MHVQTADIAKLAAPFGWSVASETRHGVVLHHPSGARTMASRDLDPARERSLTNTLRRVGRIRSEAEIAPPA